MVLVKAFHILNSIGSARGNVYMSAGASLDGVDGAAELTGADEGVTSLLHPVNNAKTMSNESNSAKIRFIYFPPDNYSVSE